MREYSRSDSARKDSKSSISLIIGIILVLLLLWDVAGPFGLWKLHRMKDEHRQLYLSDLELAKENAALEQKIKRLKGDRKYQEQVVRRELGWVRDNEILYKFLKRER